MSTFAELIIYYTQRIGIADAELARKIGVRRQTIFRWKEGVVQSPRNRKVILDIAKALRLTPEEQDALLLAAGFAPESIPAPPNQPIPDKVVTDDAPTDDDVALAAEVTEHELVPHEPASPVSIESTISAALPDNSVTLTLPDHATQADVPEVSTENTSALSKWLLWAAGIAVAILVMMGLNSFIGSGTTPIPTPVETAVPTQAPTPDPLAFCKPQKENEKLLVASKFSSFGSTKHNIAGRILEPLETEINDGGLTTLRLARYDQEITTSEEATAFLAQCGAAVVIWGEYDDSRVVANITTTSTRESRITEPASLSDLPSKINVDVPSELRVLALETLGILYRSEKKYTDSITAFNQALAPPSELPRDVPTDEQRFNLNFYLGHVYYQLAVETKEVTSFDNAIDAYNKAFGLAERLAINSAELAYNRGLAHYERYRLLGTRGNKADLDLAIEDLSLALRRKRNLVAAYSIRGNAYTERKAEGDFAKAINDFSAALALDPQGKYYFNRALSHIAAKNVASWQADLDKALELGYGPSQVYEAACYARLRQFEVDKAKEACELALAGQGEVGDNITLNYAIALAAAGETESALTQFELHLAWLNKVPNRYAARDGDLIVKWMAELEAGEQPFDRETLENLQ